MKRSKLPNKAKREARLQRNAVARDLASPKYVATGGNYAQRVVPDKRHQREEDYEDD